jgi:hypothetical protein
MKLFRILQKSKLIAKFFTKMLVKTKIFVNVFAKSLENKIF